jgi:hypothetical protein
MVRQELQFTAVADVQAALIRFALTVTLLPTPTIIAPIEDCGKMVKLEASVHWHVAELIPAKLRRALQATLFA